MTDYTADGYHMRDTPVPNAMLSEEVAHQWYDEISEGNYSRGIGLEEFYSLADVEYTDEDVGYFYPRAGVLWVFFRIVDHPAELDWEEEGEEDDYDFYIDTDQDQLHGFRSNKHANEPKGDNDYL